MGLKIYKVQDLTDGVIHLGHKIRGETGQWAFYEATVVYGPKLVNQKVGFSGQLICGMYAKAERFGRFNKICGEWDDEG